MQQALALGFFFFRKPHYPKIEDEVKFAQMRKILLAAFQAYTRVYVYVSQWNSENIKFPQFFSNSMQRYFTQIKNVKAVTKILYMYLSFFCIYTRWDEWTYIITKCTLLMYFFLLFFISNLKMFWKFCRGLIIRQYFEGNNSVNWVWNQDKWRSYLLYFESDICRYL